MSRIRRAIVWSLSTLASAAVVSGAQAQDGDQSKGSSSGGQCIAPSAIERVKECPAKAPSQGSGSTAPPSMDSGQEPKSKLREAERQQEEKKDTGPTGPGFELDTASRMNREEVEQRAWNLLQREVRVLRRLVDNTSKGDPKRPDILLRLAETYFEMQQAVRNRIRSFDEPIYKACVKQKNKQRCRQLRVRQKKLEKRLDALRQETIQTYAVLVRDHSDYGKMDRVLFALAFGLEEMEQMDRARQVYHRLIKGFPDSDFIPHAYLSFAEFYFNKGDMPAALKFYEKVTEFPPSKNPVYGYALYKSAWAYFNVDRFQKSLESFVKVMEFAQQNPDANDAKNLAHQARRELVMPYARVGSPSRAYKFFQRYAENREQALTMLESLAELYYDTGEWGNTIAVYHELMSKASDHDKLCYWQTRVTNAVISSKAKPDRVREVERLVDLYESYKSQDRPSDALNECRQEAATILISQATAWHREAIGTDSQPGTNDRNTMKQATKLYSMMLDNFPNMGDLKYPTIDRRDWPNKYKVSYYFAELLWKMEEWDKCGPAFDRVVELDPQGQYTRDAAYAAVLCYNNLYQQEYKGRERQVEDRGDGEEEYAAREFTETEKGMLDAFQRYICYIPDSEDLPSIKYRRARIYYEARHFEEAAYLFRDIAYNHTDSELSEYAANLYLDALNVLGTKMGEPRTECVLAIKESIDPLWGGYCDSQQDYDAHPDLCGVLEQLRCDVLRKEAEAYEGSQEHKKAAATYVSIFRRYRECGDLDQVLYNAAINFEAGKLLGNAIQVRNVLIERFPDSELSKKAIYLLGSNWHAIAVYDRAAEYYEKFAEKYPGESGDDCTEEEKEEDLCPIAHEALKNAVFFRLGLGDQDKAIDDANLFEKNYRRKHPRSTSQVKFAVGTIYEREEEWNRVVDHYRSFVRRYRRTALPHEIIKAYLYIVRAYWERDDRRRAKKYLRNITTEFKRRNAPKRITELDDVGERERISYLREAIDATAEALFYLAEYEYDNFRGIEFPRYRGRMTNEKIQEWSEKEFKSWVEKKRDALLAAAKEYNEIAELKVPVEGVELQSAPWQIAGAARVGDMYYRFVKQFRDAPVPDQIQKDPELRDIYLGALDQQSEPLQKQAKEKFQFCLHTATNVRWFNKWSRMCEEKLHELDPRQYPLAAELRGEPEYVYRTLAHPDPVKLGKESDGLGLGGN